MITDIRPGTARSSALRAAAFGMFPMAIALIVMSTRLSDGADVARYIVWGAAVFVVLCAIGMLAGAGRAARRERDRATLDALEPLRAADGR
ncbi:hypothetical protein ACH427_03000 [Streptomyces sp. NPDC020379]|uniref:hypothetical protein n=1 Tax=Streptomyces sp. NPDC020379 TaxID=3365071 RepID=UPI0037B6B249